MAYKPYRAYRVLKVYKAAASVSSPLSISESTHRRELAAASAEKRQRVPRELSRALQDSPRLIRLIRFVKFYKAYGVYRRL